MTVNDDNMNDIDTEMKASSPRIVIEEETAYVIIDRLNDSLDIEDIMCSDSEDILIKRSAVNNIKTVLKILDSLWE